MSTVVTPSRVYVDLDSELPSVAAMAAAEVDDLIRKEATELKYLVKLSEMISESFQGGADQRAGTRHLLDPVSTSVITKSFAHSHGTELQTYEDLVTATVRLADEMKQIEQRDRQLLARGEFLVQLKDFCLSLSKFALSSKEKLDEVMGSPDYQR